jgi:hypothetical protein
MRKNQDDKGKKAEERRTRHDEKSLLNKIGIKYKK